MTKMLKIESNTRVKDIQRDFNAIYPYLRLDFLKYAGDPSLNNERVDALIPVNRLSDKAVGQQISVDGEKTVDELLQEFREIKLFVCLLRKSGRSWITASFTGDFTLEQQNAEGEMLSDVPGKASSD